MNEREALTAKALVELVITSTQAHPAQWLNAQEILMDREGCESTERDNYNNLVGDLVDTYTTTLFNYLYLTSEQVN